MLKDCLASKLIAFGSRLIYFTVNQKLFCSFLSAFAESLEVIPSTLAENAGLNPIATVTDLRNKHACGFKSAGINVRKVFSDAVSFYYFYYI